VEKNCRNCAEYETDRTEYPCAACRRFDKWVDSWNLPKRKFKPVTEREKLTYQLERIATALEDLVEQGRASIGIATLGDLMDNHISNKEYCHMKSYQEIPDADDLDLNELEDRCD